MTQTNAELAKDLADTLQKHIEAGTFTLEAVKAIAALREQLDSMEKEIKSLMADKAERIERHNALNKDFEALKTRALNLETREQAIKVQETQIAVDKKELELTKQFMGKMEGIVTTALRSPIVRNTIDGMVPTTHGTTPNGGSTYTTLTPAKTTTETQEL